MDFLKMFKKDKRKRKMIEVVRKGHGITPETGYHLYFKKHFVACFSTLEEVNSFIKCSVFREIIKSI